MLATCSIAVKKSRSVSGSEKEAGGKPIRHNVPGTENVSYGSSQIRDVAFSGDEKMDSDIETNV